VRVPLFPPSLYVCRELTARQFPRRTSQRFQCQGEHVERMNPDRVPDRNPFAVHLNQRSLGPIYFSRHVLPQHQGGWTCGAVKDG
jgi:hypothetical protein